MLSGLHLDSLQVAKKGAEGLSFTRSVPFHVFTNTRNNCSLTRFSSLTWFIVSIGNSGLSPNT